MSPWPGYVDALSTLLMVLVFVLLVFVLAQAFLSVAISGRDQALDRLGRQVAELGDMLSLEKGKSGDLAASAAQLTQELQAAQAARDAAMRDAAGLKDALAKAVGARDAAAVDAAALKARVSDEAAELDSAQKRLAGMQARLADAASRADTAAAENLAHLSDQVRALMALRDQLTLQLAAQTAKTQAASDAGRALTAKLDEAGHVADSARAQIALLTKQIDALRAQLAHVAAALDLTQKDVHAKDLRIADLGTKLNEALASKVAELQKYRSEFFRTAARCAGGAAGHCGRGRSFRVPERGAVPGRQRGFECRRGRADPSAGGNPEGAAKGNSGGPAVGAARRWARRSPGGARKIRQQLGVVGGTRD